MSLFGSHTPCSNPNTAEAFECKLFLDGVWLLDLQTDNEPVMVPRMKKDREHLQQSSSQSLTSNARTFHVDNPTIIAPALFATLFFTLKNWIGATQHCLLSMNTIQCDPSPSLQRLDRSPRFFVAWSKNAHLSFSFCQESRIRPLIAYFRSKIDE